MTTIAVAVAVAVADEVRAEMARQQLPGTAMAKALGWSQGATSRRLRGVIPFNINELQAVADFLGVPLSALIPDSVAQPA